jgi:ribose 5-phosphate isomerase B
MFQGWPVCKSRAESNSILALKKKYINMKISIGSDHAGFELKERLIAHLKSTNNQVSDEGTYSSERADYPDFAHKVATAVEDGTVELGFLICGSANGVAMAANKHASIRCAVCWTEEISSLARAHNNANIAAMPSRFITEDTAMEIAEAFMNTEFEGGRHERRVSKIAAV